jgi:hypothetical protein
LTKNNTNEQIHVKQIQEHLFGRKQKPAGSQLVAEGLYTRNRFI